MKGAFGNGGANLFVDANGGMRRINDNDLNGDGLFDLVLPNSHGYIERGPTYIYALNDGDWKRTELPHDSCWMAKAADVDGDGYLDLIVANGENGVSSELKSYIYWGGPRGLTGERAAFDTVGAYDVAVADIDGSGRPAVIFSTAWSDHHNAGVPLYQKIFAQTAHRLFVDVTGTHKVPGLATVALLCEDLDGDGRPELVLANYREQYNHDTDSFVYRGVAGGFDTASPIRLPTHYALQVLAADLNGDGFKELVFAGGNQVAIYWNDRGVFRADCRLVLDIPGRDTQFNSGALGIGIGDVDGDAIPELVVGARDGIEIRKATDLTRARMTLPCKEGCSRVALADIRNTGRLDLIASHYCSEKSYDGESRVFWNSEHGYRTNDVARFATHGAMGCMAADLDNDGVKEIVFCNTMQGPSQYDPEFPVFVYYGTPEHRYLPEDRRDYPVKYGCHAYVAADVDNDGWTELLLTTGNGVRVFKGTPQGPDPANYYDVPHTPGSIVLIGAVLVADFNRDGWLDMIITPWVYGDSPNELENSTYVYFGGPDGFSNARRMALPAYTASAPSVLLADINRDGYLDFLYGDKRGYIGVYYGGPDGFDRKRFGKIPLKDFNGAILLGLAVADIDGDGWPELFLSTGGHYTHRASHLYVLRDGKNGFPMEEQTLFETGGTAGFPALADMRGRGHLDLLLPFYSTHETRELPARIFRGDGKGHFDWANPLSIDCLASIAFCPVDLTGNGYPDLFICCHRNNLGHIVNSKLIMNGPNGLDLEHAQDILGYGPHCFTLSNQGNAMDRSDREYYTSPVFACVNPVRLGWEGETPLKTAISFRVRFGRTAEETLGAAWSERIVENGGALHAPCGAKHMQYKASFQAPGFVNSPRLSAVAIECDRTADDPSPA
ncbi:MAG: VCBS repeat-containing protein [Kiritimatiellae bacterium]|nr:VCBS repeat-containing protein [Kiritimatiellia bacterium]